MAFSLALGIQTAWLVRFWPRSAERTTPKNARNLEQILLMKISANILTATAVISITT
jgi:hypothetical protein